VLAQIGLIDDKILPIVGRDQARKVLDKTLASNTRMTRWKESEGK
jgi:carboxymethylenebutenolidase